MMTVQEQKMFDLSHNIRFQDVPEWVRISEMRVPKSGRNPKKPVIAVDKQGREVHRFESTAAAIKFLGRKANSMRRWIRTGEKIGGYYWQYAEEE